MTLTRVDLAVIGIALAAITLSYFLNRRRQLNNLRGPKADSYLCGVEHQLKLEEYAGRLMSKWAEQYGPTYKVSGCFGEKILVSSDPRAIQHILHEHNADYPPPKDVRLLSDLIFGRSVITVYGNDHKRHRRVLSPAFSINHMKSFAPLFQRHVTQLTAQWNAVAQQGTKTWDIIPWVHKVTLDIIGESSFDYDFQALKDKPNELTSALRDFENLSLEPSPLQTLMEAIPRYLPQSIAAIQANYLPISIQEAATRYLKVASKKAQEMMQQSGLALDGLAIEKELTGKEKDVLSVLMKANRAEDPQKQLTEYEVLSQMALLIQAGHHTTGYSIAWTLYELARHPADQQRVYDEIQRVREKTSGGFTAGDYDDLGNGWLGFCVKETLRLHPVVIHLNRDAKYSDIIPLECPIESSAGATIAEVPIQPGQRIIVDIATYNRLVSVWGPDANEWNPSRFNDPTAKAVTVGMTSNILSFSGGSKGCIGWRFALMELHALVSGLVELFDFSLPEDVKIKARFMGLALPVVDGKEDAGPMLPMVIRPRGV